MKKERKDDSFIKQPYYPGGDKALGVFIIQNLKYPEISKANKVEGDVHLKIDINHKGDVIDVKIIGGLDIACNEEAIRVVKILKYIVPKTPRNLKVTFHKNIRIHFNIENTPYSIDSNLPSNNVVQSVHYNYNVIEKPVKSDVDTKEKIPTTYQYVVKY